MPKFNNPFNPPSRKLLLLELRAAWELQSFFTIYPLLRLAARGDGHPVLVLPGLSASDISTLPLRRYLQDQGWAAYGWNLGKNFGPRPGVEEGLRNRLDELHAQHGRKVSLIGWSLGGILARELVRHNPRAVRQVITLGSPFAGEPRATNAWRLYEHVSGRTVEEPVLRKQIRKPVPVPSTAIFTRTDGIVAWQSCLEQQGPYAENIEVEGSHCGLGHNPAVLYAVADRLAQPEDRWLPFFRGGIRALVYPDPQRNDVAEAAEGLVQ